MIHLVAICDKCVADVQADGKKTRLSSCDKCGGYFCDEMVAFQTDGARWCGVCERAKYAGQEP